MDDRARKWRRDANKRWRAANPEKLKKSRQRRMAAMTLEERSEYYRRIKYNKFKFKPPPKPEKCEVCNGGGVICLDHCHVENKFRGWLCNSCNSALGYARDNPDILRKLAEYLEQIKRD